MSTKFKQNIQITGEVNATTLRGDGSAITGLPVGYADSDVDTHLNQNNPTAGYVLTWNGADYSWTANGTGAGLGDVVDDITPQLGGNLESNGSEIQMADNNKIALGTGERGYLRHTGASGKVQLFSTVGGIDIRTTANDETIAISSDDGSGGIANYIIADGSTGATELYNYGSKKLETTSTGVTVTGNTTVTGNLLFDSSGTITTVVDSATTARTITLPDATGTVLLADGDGSNLTNVTASSVQVTESSDDNVAYNVLFSDTSGSGNVQMTPIQDDGGLSFNPGINQLSVGSVYLYSTGGVVFEGSNDDYETFFNAVNPTADRNIDLPDASGTVVLDGTLNTSIDTHLNQSNPQSGYVLSWTGSDYAWVVNNGTVFDLVQDLTPQLGGNLDANGKNISFGDSATPGTDDTLSFGAGNDLQIYHNSTDGHNYMQLNDKRLYIKAVDDGLTGPFIIFDHETTSPSTVDFSTVLAATSRDSNGASQTISQLTFGTPNVTSGSFRGSLRFDVTDSNGLVEYVRLDGNSDIIDLKKAVRFSEAFTFPTTDGTPNQVLQTNGSGVVTWATVSGGGGSGTPGGSNTEVQFNNAGAFGGDSDFTYNSTTNVLTVGSIESNAAGTPTITSNSAVNISVGSSVIIQQNSGGGGFRLGNMTTTERNALSSANGEMIYNTTDNKLQGYENGSWTNLIGSGTYSNSDVDAHLNQSNPNSGYVLSWNGSDYAWVTNAGGGGLVDLVDDTTPQLGGDLYVNGNTIRIAETTAGAEGIFFENQSNGYGTLLYRNDILHSFYILNYDGDILISNIADDRDVVISTDNGSGSSAQYFRADGSTGEVKLYHYGNEKFKTTSTGVQTTGEINVNGAYSLPTAVGTSGQVLAVPNSGTVLEFVDSPGGGGSSAADDITTGDAAVNIATTTGNITIDAQGNDTDIIFKGTDNNVDVTFLTFDGSEDTAKFETDKVQFQPATGAMAAQISNTSIAFYRDVSLIKPVGYGSVELIFQEAGDYSTTISHTSPASQNQTITLPDATGTVLTTGNSDTPTTTTSSSDVDHVLVNDGGVMKKITTSDLGIGGGGGGGTGDITFSASDISTNADTMNFKVDANNDDTGYEGYYFYGGPTSQGYVRLWTNDAQNETAIKFHVDGTSYYTAMLQRDDQFKMLLNEHGGNIPARIYNMANGTSGHLDLGTRHADGKVRVVDSWTGSLYYALPRATPNNGDVLTASDASGTLAWSAPSGGGDVVDDTSPQLGGNLDVNGKDIVSASNGNIEIKPDGTGNVYMQFDDPDAGELIINKPPTTDTDTLLLQDCHQVWNTTATTNGTAVALALHPGTDSGSSQAITFLRAVRGQGDRGNFEINCKKYNVHGYHKTVFYGGETNVINYIDNARVEFPGNIKLKSDGPAGTFASAKVGARNVFQITAPNAPSHYTFNDPDSHWFPTAADDPTLYLRRGETYYFVINASGHPFEIRDSTNQIYNTGVTNNTTAVGTIIWKVPMSASATNYKYVCTAHANNMQGSIQIV